MSTSNVKAIFIVGAAVILIIFLTWLSRNDNADSQIDTSTSTSTSTTDVSTNVNATSSSDVPNVINKLESSKLKSPPGFTVGIFAKNLPGARDLVIDSLGNIWVSQTKEGTVSKLTIKNGELIEQRVVIRGLKNPHGIVFDPQDANILYIAEENKISKTSIDTPEKLQKIIDLPSGGNHYTRSLVFSPEGRLYVSIGSTCNVCRETDERYAAIYSLNKDGSDLKQVAKGLRNSVFLIWDDKDSTIWATEMGRDYLGDNTPPDEVNIIKTTENVVQNFGWPICYGANVHDTAFDKNTYIRNPCLEPFEKPSQIDLQAHSAPLGLAKIPSDWPQEYQNNLLIAFHGSWNRSVPTGYKVVQIKLNNENKKETQSDFLTGFLEGNDVIGRPVDLIFDKDSALYISDDRAGVIYKVINN